MSTGHFRFVLRCFTRSSPYTLSSLADMYLWYTAYSLTKDKPHTSKSFRFIEEKVREHFQVDLLPATVVQTSSWQSCKLSELYSQELPPKDATSHFCQALLRKVQHLGLQTEYQDNTDVRSFVSRIAALCFCSPQIRPPSLDGSKSLTLQVG